MAGGGTVLGAGVEAHGLTGGAISEKKSKAELYALEIGRDKVLGSLGKITCLDISMLWNFKFKII